MSVIAAPASRNRDAGHGDTQRPAPDRTSVSTPVSHVTSTARGTRLHALLRSVGDALGWTARAIVRLPGQVLLGLLWIYQRFISPLTPPTCRYYPSCSQYAVIAVRDHGALRGGWLAMRRLGRCHPWARGGIDDVPPPRERAGCHGSDHGDGARSSTR